MHIQISLRNYRCFGEAPTTIELKKGILAIVGPNNSGKSTLLRFFYEFRPIFASLSDGHILVEAIKGNLDVPQIPSIRDVFQLFHKGSNNDLEISITADLDSIGKFGPKMTIHIGRVSRKITLSFSDLSNVPLNQLAILSGSILGTHTPHAAPLYDLNPAQKVMKELCKTIYIGPFRSVTDQGATGDYFDLKVGQSFVHTWNQIKTGDNAAHTNIALQVRREIQKLFNFSEFEINATEDRQSLQIIIDEGSFKIHELGSGLTQFIITFAHAAIAQPNYILIDEPESNLHASMQLSFVLSLASFAKEALVFSTHSLGLARSTADEILAVQRKSPGQSVLQKFEAVEPLSQLVGELNFSAYQQLGFTVLLLVEGVTEVKTIQQFLRKLRVEQKVLLVPLYGTSMINDKREHELDELKRITPRIFALIDSERDSEKASLPKSRSGFKKVCDRLKIDCHVLERRTLENYFPSSAIKKIGGAVSRALDPFEDVKAMPGWSKANNWKIAQQMAVTDLQETDLLDFLKKVATAAGG